MKKVACGILQKLIIGIAVVIIGLFAVPICFLLGMITVIWNAADAAIRCLE